MIVAANNNHPPFGLFILVHPSSGVRCLCCKDLRVLLEHGWGLGGDFVFGKVVGRRRSEGERYSGSQVTPPLHRGGLLGLYFNL